MANYQTTATNSEGVRKLRVTEFNLYGSRRLGIIKKPESIGEADTAPIPLPTMASTRPDYTAFNEAEPPTLVPHTKAFAKAFGVYTTGNVKYTYGTINYELSNHLGNVLTVISDRKLPIDNAGAIGYYTADILKTQDYYAFGSTMPGRSFGTEDYKFGFNGKENDNETYGTGNALDFGARVYDPRIGRWLSTDPLQTKYPNVTPYAYTRNSPIARIDVGGYFDIEIDAALAATGKTVLDYPRYTTILQNIKTAVQDQDNIISYLMDQTGYSREKVLSDLDFGSGPTIFITNDPSVDFLQIRTSPQSFARGGIFINYTVLDAFENMDASSDGFNEQVSSWALNLLHEYTHYGDRDNNGGNVSGQWDMQGKKKVYEADDPSVSGFKVQKRGSQCIPESWTGHRGTDVEVGLFNVKLSLDQNGKFTVDRNVKEKNVTLKAQFAKIKTSDFDKLGKDLKVK